MILKPHSEMSPRALARLNQWRIANGLEWDQVDETLERVLSQRKESPWCEPPCEKVEEFVCSPHYMNAPGRVWDQIMRELEDANSGQYAEMVLTGGIGWGKTTAALYTQAFQLHKLLCYKNPHGLFDLQSTDEIVVIFQSMKLQQAKEVAYGRFKAMIDDSPWFQKPHRAYDHTMKSQMKFPRHIVVKPVAGNEGSNLGANVIGGILDEVNFMATIEKSQRTDDGGTFEQAKVLYNAIARRRESRFMVQGELPGMLCLVSSKRFRGQFTDEKEDEAKTNKRIKVVDHRLWEVCPPGRFAGPTFEVYIGDEHHKPFVCSADRPAPDDANTAGMVMDVPIEYRPQFDRDLLNALRDIAGISTTALHPFIMEPERVVECFGKHASVFSREMCDFDQQRLMIFPKEIKNPNEPRWIHIDLAITRDSCGFAVGYVKGFTKILRGTAISEHDKTPAYEIMPQIHMDGVLEIQPPRGGEIIYERIRNIIYTLTKMGMKIRWITFDSFQSADSMQILSRKGYTTGDLSLDKSTGPYEIAKQALYDGRVDMPAHEKCLKEFLRLERDEVKEKIDHRVNESKDCSDAVAGVVSGLTQRRWIWHRFNVPTRDMPSFVGHTLEDERMEDESDKKTDGRTEAFKKRHERSVRKGPRRG